MCIYEFRTYCVEVDICWQKRASSLCLGFKNVWSRNRARRAHYQHIILYSRYNSRGAEALHGSYLYFMANILTGTHHRLLLLFSITSGYQMKKRIKVLARSGLTSSGLMKKGLWRLSNSMTQQNSKPNPGPSRRTIRTRCAIMVLFHNKRVA